MSERAAANTADFTAEGTWSRICSARGMALTSRLPFVLLPAAVFGVASLAAAPSQACVGACSQARFAPSQGSTLPGSVTAFPLMHIDDGDLVIHDASGAEVAGTLIRGAVFSRFELAAPLTPGEYTARWKGGNCAPGPPEQKSRFTIVAAAPLPSKSGTLTVKSAVRKPDAALPSSSAETGCRDPIDAAIVVLDVMPDPSLAPYAPVVVWETTVDGAPWSYELPFEVGQPMSNGPRSLRGAKQLFAACDGRPRHDNGVAPGTHDIAMRAIVGGATIEAARLRVRISCGEKNGEVVSPEGPLEVEAALPESSSAGEPPGPRAPDGCSTVPARTRSTGAFLVGAVLAVGALRRRSAQALLDQ